MAGGSNTIPEQGMSLDKRGADSKVIGETFLMMKLRRDDAVGTTASQYFKPKEPVKLNKVNTGTYVCRIPT